VLKEELGLDAELKTGSGGIFEVAVDGAVVAKRGFTGFPSEEEIVQAVSKAGGQLTR
jgi:selenoprotein W-related protein